MRAETEGVAFLQAVDDAIEDQVDLAAQDIAGFLALMRDGGTTFRPYGDVVDIALQEMSAFVGYYPLEGDARPIAWAIV